MKFKSIIFDLDGTIIDTDHIWKKATEELITSKGVQMTPEVFAALNKKIRGLALHNSCSIIKETFGLGHAIVDLVQEKQDRAKKLYEEKVTFIKGFENFFSRAIDQHLKVAIATNADNHTLDVTIKKLNLRDYFGEHIYNIAHVNYVGKPAPDVYLHAAAKLGIKPEKCLVIEDSTHGIEAANRAGMFCIGINSAGNKEALKNARFIINHYDEIDLTRLLKKKKWQDEEDKE